MTPETQPPDEFKEMAWLGFIHWAISKESLRSRFEEASGLVFIELAKGGLASLIDKACGVREGNFKYFKAFTIWLTENYWGESEAPEIYFRKFKDA